LKTNKRKFKELNVSARRPQTSAKANLDSWSRSGSSSDLDSGFGWLPHFSGDFFVHRYLYHKIFMKTHMFFQRCEPDCGIIPQAYLEMLKNS